jgi:hypothetical protein
MWITQGSYPHPTLYYNNNNSVKFNPQNGQRYSGKHTPITDYRSPITDSTEHRLPMYQLLNTCNRMVVKCCIFATQTSEFP